MKFDPSTGHFVKHTVSGEKVAFSGLEHKTEQMKEESQTLREHLHQTKQHLREIKARLRTLETEKPQETSPVATSTTITVQEKADTSALEAKISDLQAAHVELSKRQIILENKKPSNLVQVSVDDAYQTRVQELEKTVKNCMDLIESHVEANLEFSREAQIKMEKLETKFKASVYFSVASTIVLIAIKFLF